MMISNRWVRLILLVLIITLSIAMTKSTTKELDAVGYLENKWVYKLSVFILYLRGLLFFVFDLMNLFPIE